MNIIKRLLMAIINLKEETVLIISNILAISINEEKLFRTFSCFRTRFCC